MKKNHLIYSKTHSKAEMMTSDLGLLIYKGKRDLVKKELSNDNLWKEDAKDLFTSALFGHQWEIARDLLKAGMPISDSTYKEIYYWGDQSLLNELPPRPEIINALKQQSGHSAFLHAIVDGDLGSVKKLFTSEWVNLIWTDILGERVKKAPLHYAARGCHFEIIGFLINNGAEVNALTENGKSPLTLVAECPKGDKINRRKCFRILKKNGAVLIPEVKSWFKRWRFSRGAWKRS